ncbi:MAG: response regulator [Longimicrobiales bacterium]
MGVILVVDDEQSSREILTTFLEGAGYEVVPASDGQEALDLLQKHEVRAIITDLRMPNVNGLRLIRSLRENGDTIPIVAVSGINRDQLMLAEDYGANVVLPKPVDRDELIKIMEQVLSDSRDDWSGVWIHPEFGNVGDY